MQMFFGQKMPEIDLIFSLFKIGRTLNFCGYLYHFDIAYCYSCLVRSLLGLFTIQTLQRVYLFYSILNGRLVGEKRRNSSLEYKDL